MEGSFRVLYYRMRLCPASTRGTAAKNGPLAVRVAYIVSVIASALAAQSLSAVDLVIASSHAAAFYAILERDPGPTTLVNVDAHDDLAAHRDSDRLRAVLFSRSASPAQVLSAQRGSGAVACWNWIEPLMPYPVERVLWAAPAGAKALTKEELEKKLKLGRRFGGKAVARTDLKDLAASLPAGAWILSIDLDYLGDDPDPDPDPVSALRGLLALCRSRPPLFAVAAVSMPYLPSDSRAGILARALVDAALAETDWRIIIDPRPGDGTPDEGRMDALAATGRAWLDYDPADDGLADYLRARSAAASIRSRP